MAEPDEDSATQDAQAPQPAQASPDVDDEAWEGFVLDDTVFRHGSTKD